MESNQYFVGLDLHRDTFTVYGSDKYGNECLRGKYTNSRDSVDEVIESFPARPSVVIEAPGNWMWLIDNLRSRGCEVTLAHPLRTKAIASAKILCHMLRSGLIPASYIATPSELEDREIARGRIQLVHDQTQVKNRIRALLAKENLTFKGVLFGKKGRLWLESQELTPARRLMTDILLKRLDSIQGGIAQLDRVFLRSGLRPPTLLYQKSGI